MLDCNLSEHYHTIELPEQFVAGIEYEIEDVLDIKDGFVGQYGFNWEEDHSLRNRGKEFKTGPCTYQQCLDSFKHLHDKLVLGAVPFSERTSIHVHVNVGNFKPAPARNLVLLYAMLEPLFFHFAGPLRKNNIYCVPLSHTCVPSIYNRAIDWMCQSGHWHKYTAFNVLPISTLGTVEFRHLGGTGDFNRFTTWLTEIKNLHDAIYEDDVDVLDFLKKKGDPISLARKILPYFTADLSTTQLKEMMYDSILDVKLAQGAIT